MKGFINRSEVCNVIGPSIRLRSEIMRREAQIIAEWLKDEDILLHLSDAPGVSQAIEQALSRVNLPVVTHLFNQGGRFFLAEDNGVPAGFVRLVAGDRDMQIVLMIERGRWGRGLGSAVLREALKQAFFEMRTQRVIAVIHRDNHRSLRLFARAGFALAQDNGLWTRHTLTLSAYLQYLQKKQEVKSMANPIRITKTDRERLERMIDEARIEGADQSKSYRALREEIDRAIVVESQKLPPTVVSMRSRALIALDDTEEEISLVYPDEADWMSGKLSILSPIGTALLGYGEGDRVEWEVPGGLKRIEIRKVLYQPEAAGDYHL